MRREIPTYKSTSATHLKQKRKEKRYDFASPQNNLPRKKHKQIHTNARKKKSSAASSRIQSKTLRHLGAAYPLEKSSQIAAEFTLTRVKHRARFTRELEICHFQRICRKSATAYTHTHILSPLDFRFRARVFDAAIYRCGEKLDLRASGGAIFTRGFLVRGKGFGFLEGDFTVCIYYEDYRAYFM